MFANEIQFIKTWDFNERNLSLEDGVPSRIGFVMQPRVNILEIFGDLGFFNGDLPGKKVAFAQVFTLEPKISTDANGFGFKASSSYENLVFTFFVRDKAGELEGYSHQAIFKPKLAAERIYFAWNTLQPFRRGRPWPRADELDPRQIVKLGWMITKSSQQAPLSTLEERIPFDLKILKIDN